MFGLEILCAWMLFVGAERADAYPVDTEIWMSEGVALPGDTLLVPIVMGEIEGYSILSLGIDIQYDARVAHAIGIEQAGTQTASWMPAFGNTITDSAGTLHIAAISAADTIEGNGVLMFVRFAVSSSVGEGDSTSVVFEKVLLDEIGPPALLRDGCIRIVESVSPWGISPAAVPFGRVMTIDSQDRIVRISNPGTWPLTLTGLDITAGADAFEIVSSTMPQTVQPDDTLDVTIRFAPEDAGMYTGALTIASAAYSHPDTTVTLTGRGTLIEVTPDADSVLVDTTGYVPIDFTTAVFTVERVLPDRTKQDATSIANWSSTDPAGAEVIGSVARGITPGTVRIVAALQALSDTSTLKVIQLGDVNTDAAVDVQDVLVAIDHIVHRTLLTDAFKRAAVDRNADTRINVLDPIKMLVLDILRGPLGGTPKSVAGPVALIVPREVSPSNGIVSIPMVLQSEGSLSAMQFEIRYDSESLAPVGVELTDRCEGMEGTYHTEGGVLYGVVYSLTGGEIPTGASSVLDVSFEWTGDVREDTEVMFARTILANALGDAVPVRAWDGSVSVRSVVPGEYGLSQNHPNPFNPETTISYDVSRAGTVRLLIYALNGQQIRTLVNEERPAGRYSTMWDGRDDAGRGVASGVYLCRLESHDHSVVRKMVLVK